jgi:hypothetical protein
MIGGFSVKGSADVFDPQYIDEKRGEFKNTFLQVPDFIVKRGIIE